MKTKICSKCSKEKIISDFHKHKSSKDRLMYQCKDCWNEICRKFRESNPDKVKTTNKNSYQKKKAERLLRQKEYSIKNKERILAYAKNYRLKNPDNSRKQSLNKFGLNLDDFYLMLKNQNNSCAICFKIFNKKSDAHLDHNHTTNKHRAFLCSACNTAIGLVNEKTETLKTMIEYINLWSFQK